MSGPIVRRYGFPNFEKIFGERDIKHGADEPTATPEVPPSATEPAKPTPEPQPTKTDAGPAKP